MGIDSAGSVKLKLFRYRGSFRSSCSETFTAPESRGFCSPILKFPLYLICFPERISSGRGAAHGCGPRRRQAPSDSPRFWPRARRLQRQGTWLGRRLRFQLQACIGLPRLLYAPAVLRRSRRGKLLRRRRSVVGSVDSLCKRRDVKRASGTGNLVPRLLKVVY